MNATDTDARIIKIETARDFAEMRQKAAGRVAYSMPRIAAGDVAKAARQLARVELDALAAEMAYDFARKASATAGDTQRLETALDALTEAATRARYAATVARIEYKRISE
jgi:hypothetical protein